MDHALRPPRKTRHRYEVVGHVRFLTFSCFHRLPLLRNDAIKGAFVESLVASRERTGFRLFAWVVMPEHVHLLITPRLPEYPVSVLLRDLKSHLANRVLRRWRETGAPILDRLSDSRGKARFWQVGGGYDRNVFSDNELFEKLAYIHANPVRRGLVSSETEWAWSSARWYSTLKETALIEIDPIPR